MCQATVLSCFLKANVTLAPIALVWDFRASPFLGSKVAYKLDWKWLHRENVLGKTNSVQMGLIRKQNNSRFCFPQCWLPSYSLSVIAWGLHPTCHADFPWVSTQASWQMLWLGHSHPGPHMGPWTHAAIIGQPWVTCPSLEPGAESKALSHTCGRVTPQANFGVVLPEKREWTLGSLNNGHSPLTG